MLHLVEMEEKLPEAKARHASQSAKASPPQAVAISSGEPKAKSLGAAKSKSKALAFVGTLSAQQSFLQGRPPSHPNTKNLVHMTWTQPRENCTTTDCIQFNAEGSELALAYETVETNDLAEVMGMDNVKLVLLSFFGGIGAAHVALANLGVKPSFAMSFETDEECKSVLRAHFPDVELIGSYDLYAAEELMECIKKATAASNDFVILVTAGPPCPDFSRIKGSHGAHRSRG